MECNKVSLHSNGWYCTFLLEVQFFNDRNFVQFLPSFLATDASEILVMTVWGFKLEISEYILLRIHQNELKRQVKFSNSYFHWSSKSGIKALASLNKSLCFVYFGEKNYTENSLTLCKLACKVDCDVKSGVDPLPFWRGREQKMLGFSQVLKPIKWLDLLQERKYGCSAFRKGAKINFSEKNISGLGALYWEEDPSGVLQYFPLNI